MKKLIPILIAAILTGLIGFVAGKFSCQSSFEKIQNFRSVEAIKSDLKQREIDLISTLLSGNAKIENRGLLKRNRYKVLTGTIKNKSLLARAKDISVVVTFLSKTKSEVGRTEFTIYDFVNPGDTKNFEKKINVSDDVAEFKWDIISAKAE